MTTIDVCDLYSGRGATFRDSDICTQTRRRSSEYNPGYRLRSHACLKIISLATPLIGQIDDIPRHRRLSMTTCRSQTPRRSRVHPCFGFLASGASMILWLAWTDLFDTCRPYSPCQSSNGNTRGTGDTSIGSIGSIGRLVQEWMLGRWVCRCKHPRVTWQQ